MKLLSDGSKGAPCLRINLQHIFKCSWGWNLEYIIQYDKYPVLFYSKNRRKAELIIMLFEAEDFDLSKDVDIDISGASCCETFDPILGLLAR